MVVVADGDEPGREHARSVADSLDGVAASVDVVEPAKGKDISEHLAAGGSLGQLRELEAEKIDCTTKGSPLLQSIGTLPIAPLPEVLANAPAEPEWRWEGYLASTALTLLAGRPKVGKSTLIFALIAAIVTGRRFLGRGVARGGVLVLSEERRDSIAEKARAFGLDDSDVHVLMRHEAHGIPWAEIVVEARTYCKAHGLGVLVVDTFDKWTGLRGDDENKSGPVLEALEPLARAAGDGLAVLISSHQRKADGNFGEAVRGSNALTGGVDVVVELERAPASAQAGGSARVLNAVSRFAATPEELAVELEEGTYRACGDLAALKAEAEDQKLGEALTEHPQTVAEIAELAELGAATVRRRLDVRYGRGEVEREGSGKRGDPYRYRRRPIDCNAPDPLGGAINQSALEREGVAA